jgi:hypothetical protein
VLGGSRRRRLAVRASREGAGTRRTERRRGRGGSRRSPTPPEARNAAPTGTHWDRHFGTRASKLARRPRASPLPTPMRREADSRVAPRHDDRELHLPAAWVPGSAAPRTAPATFSRRRTAPPPPPPPPPSRDGPDETPRRREGSIATRAAAQRTAGTAASRSAASRVHSTTGRGSCGPSRAGLAGSSHPPRSRGRPRTGSGGGGRGRRFPIHTTPGRRGGPVRVPGS